MRSTALPSSGLATAVRAQAAGAAAARMRISDKRARREHQRRFIGVHLHLGLASRTPGQRELWSTGFRLLAKQPVKHAERGEQVKERLDVAYGVAALESPHTR